jgi:hypothetical protein
MARRAVFVKRTSGEVVRRVTAGPIRDEKGVIVSDVHGVEVGPKGWMAIVSADLADAIKDSLPKDEIETHTATEADVKRLARYDRKEHDAVEEHVAAVTEAGGELAAQEGQE